VPRADIGVTDDLEVQRKLIEELRAHIAQLQDGLTWTQEQRDAWERAAHAHEATIEEFRAHLHRQAESIQWLEAQRATWEHAAHANEERVAELQAQVRRMEQFVQRMTSSEPNRG
jgi:chromosome segregation ATPase